ncbi:MAG: cytochrome-c peroxidase [Saprospiraceae bacterium]|nr:cytochrome-c peroxidase [Saprospiraceae bacterium]
MGKWTSTLDMWNLFYGICYLLLFSNLGCQEKSYSLNIPTDFPDPSIPEDNVPNVVRVQLGKKLFFDTQCSLDSTIACSSCHLPERAFTDGQVTSPGIYGRRGKRNTPSLLNAAYLGLVNKDGGVIKLDIQPLVPIEDENEMGISILKLAERLSQDPEYVQLSQEAYGRAPDPYVITRALSSFVRTLYSGDSYLDQYSQGDATALSSIAIAGKKLFESERLNCTACHHGFNFTNNAFENNGLYINYQDIGRALITLDSSDTGKFRVPSLRNVAITAPYMHDGSLGTLEDVIDHYEKTGNEPTQLQSKKTKRFYFVRW